MHLLVVHRDAEVGEQLVKMVEDYTPHRCDGVRGDAAALAWGRGHARCGLLLVQLEAPLVDGFAVGGSLSEMFPGLQTIFLPGYAVAEQRLEVADTKVFPEPINGELLLNTIERLAAAPPGAPDYFHALDVLQMCCLAKRGGALQFVRGNDTGVVFLKEGQLVDADTARSHGLEALMEIASWDVCEFAYDGSVRGGQTISKPWHEALVEAVIRNREAKQAREGSADSTAVSAAENSKLTDIPAKPAPAKRGLFSSLRRG